MQITHLLTAITLAKLGRHHRQELIEIDGACDSKGSEEGQCERKTAQLAVQQ